MRGRSSLKTVLHASIASILVLFPGTSSAASPPATAVAAEGAAILMGVAVAAPLQTASQQAADREALKKRLYRLLDANMGQFSGGGRPDNLSRIIRVVFDVGIDGRAINVRVGKRSGSRAADNVASSMISRFKGLPGGERRRVCALLQYGHAGQDPKEAGYVEAFKDATDSAIIDMRAGRDGPDYDRRGRIIVET